MKIVLFDGDCAFCNKSVLLILKNNKKSKLFVCASQSEKGKQLITQYDIKANPEETLIFICDAKVHTLSGGVLRISKYMGGLYPLLWGFILVPPFIRDGLYIFISRRRKKLAKSDACSFEIASKYSKQVLG